MPGTDASGTNAPLTVKLAPRHLDFSVNIFPGAIVMVQHEGAFRPLIYTSGDGETEIPGYLAVPGGTARIRRC